MNTAIPDIAPWPSYGTEGLIALPKPVTDKQDDPDCPARFALHCPISKQVGLQRPPLVEHDDFVASQSVLSWTHSVVYEADFVDVWTALDKAFHLAADVSLDWDIDRPLNGCVLQNDFSNKVHVVPKSLRVSFCDDVEVLIGLEDELHFRQIQIPQGSLADLDKPWSLNMRVQDSDCASDGFFFPKTDAARRQLEEAEPDNTSDRTFLHDHLKQGSFRHLGKTSFVSSAPCRAWTRKTCPAAYHHATGTSVNNGSRSTSPTKGCMLIQSHGNCSDSMFGQLNNHLMHLTTAPSADPSVLLPLNRVRRDFESPIAWVPDDQGQEDAHDIDEDPPLFNHHVPPAFVHDLAHRLARLGFDPDDLDFDIAVRTWYIDHATVRRWTAPRVLQLVGPPTGWEMQFSSLWIDQIDPDEWFDLTIITPDPPRPPSQRHYVLDLVITQSLDLPRVAGLVTIIPEDRDTFDLYSVACSFEEHISGFDIISAADVAYLCRHHSCRITFGWQEIPNTLRPTHDTGHGDGFQVLIRNSPAMLASRVEDDHSFHASGDASGSSDRPFSTPQANISSSSTGQAIVHTANSSQGASRFMTALHLFQYQGQEIIMHLVNAQLVQPSHEMATALNVPLNCLEAVYPIPTRPIGFPELAIPAIVQRTGDIAPRSTDRLILIDVRYLNPPAQDGSIQKPVTVRTVQRVGYQVLRSHLLLTAGVFHYCQFLDQRCTLSLDGTIWPQDDHHSRPVRHGSYVVIDVPPHADHSGDTQMLVETIHDDVEHDTFMQFLTEDSDHDDAALLQTPPPASKDQLSQPPSAPSDQACKVSDVSLPQFHPNNDRRRSLGAVLRPKAVLNPQDPMHAEDAQNLPTDAPSSTAVTAKPDVMPGSTGIDASLHATKQIHVNKKVSQQTKIDSFFRTSKTVKPCQTAKKQAMITNFFKKGPRQPEDKPPVNSDGTKHPVPEDDLPASPEGTEQPMQQTHNSSRQHRCSEQQTVSAPNFQADIPAPLPQAEPAQRPRPIWMLELSSLFEEFATTTHRETGPEMEIDVWYMHHHRMSRCDAPRTVRLDNMHELWYADICTVWFDRIARQEPLRVLIVKPRPVRTMRSRAPIHVILEQGMTQGLVALHFTAVFHGGPREGVYQVVESVPDHISTNLMIDRHNFWMFCQERPCNMWSGILRFHPDQREEIFSGISVLLEVAEPIASAAASSSHTPVDDMTVLMQQTGMRQQGPAGQASHVPTHTPVSQVSTNLHDAHHGPAVDNTHAQHQTSSPPVNAQPPLLRIRALDEFRQTLTWQADRQPSACPMQPQRRLIVHTWFSDALRMPRSDHFRAVLLGTLPMHWPFEILSRWQDFIDPAQEVALHMVQPQPSGGDPDVIAHVIVLQAHDPATRAALVTVVELLEDPWHPTSFCTLLPTQVTAQVIMQEAGITERCRPLTSQRTCEVMHGSVCIDDTTSFPVRHGYQFEVALSSLDEEWDEATTFIQLSFGKIQHYIRQLDQTVHATMQAALIQSVGTDQAVPTRAVTTTVLPPLRQGHAADSLQFLNFHSILQCAWQPLSLLSARPFDPDVTVVTWYLDHVRFPQCFAPRAVQLYQDPHE